MLLRTRAYIIREVDGFQQEAKTVDLERAAKSQPNGDFHLKK